MPDTDPVPDVDAITDALLRVSRLLVAASARSAAAVDESLTLPQFRLLVLLDTRGPLKLVTVAELLGVNPSTVTRMVDRLVTAGMAERHANPTSRRENFVTLTSTGAAVVREVSEKRRAEIARIVGSMSPESRHGIVSALTAFAEAGDEPPVHSSPYESPAIAEGAWSTGVS